MSAGGLAIIHLCKEPVLTCILSSFVITMRSVSQSTLLGQIIRVQAMCNQMNHLVCILVMLDNHVVLQTCCLSLCLLAQDPDALTAHMTSARTTSTSGELPNGETLYHCQNHMVFCKQQCICMMTNNVFRLVEHTTYSTLLRLAQLWVLILVELQHPFQLSHTVQGLPQLPSHAAIGGMLTVLPT